MVVTQIHQYESCCIPHFVTKVSVGNNPIYIKIDIPALFMDKYESLYVILFWDRIPVRYNPPR